MQITAERGDLLAALNRVAGVVTKNPNVPILNNLHLTAKDGALSIQGTDLTVHASTSCPADVESAGETTVDAARLRDIVNATATGSQVCLSLGATDDPRMSVHSGRSRFKVPVIRAEDYPVSRQEDWSVTFDMPSEVLADMLARAQIAASQDASKPVLTGVCLHVVGGSLRAAATSGFKVARVSVFLPQGASEAPAIVLPARTVNLLTKALGDSRNCTVSIIKGRVRVTTEAVILTSKLLDYDFVDYERTIPQSTPVLARADRASLVAAIRRAQIAGDTDTLGSGVKLALTHGQCIVSGHNGESDASDEIECDYSGDGIVLGLNSGHAVEVLEALEGETAHLGITDTKMPVVVTSPDDEGALFMLVQRRVK